MIRSKYHPSSIALHWLMFLLFAVALVCIEIRGGVPRATGQALRDQLRGWHVDAGLLVLLFAALRVGARWCYGAPATIGAPLQVKMAHVLHGLLYLVMFLLPITGVVFAEAGGRAVELFGYALPVLVAPNHALSVNVKNVHELLGNAVYYLVGLHAAAALWHHLVLKDDTLKRMRFNR